MRRGTVRDFDIRPWVLGVSVFLATLVCCSQAASQEQFMLPCGVPFECATDIRMSNATASWKMSYDRRFAGVYDIVHWEVVYADGHRVEFLAQLLRPQSGRAYYRFFVHERHGVWWTLGIRKRWIWREVPAESRERDQMSARLRQLYGIADSLRRGAIPASLRF